LSTNKLYSVVLIDIVLIGIKVAGVL